MHTASLSSKLVLEPLREPEFDLDAIHAAVDKLAGCLYRPEAAPTNAPEDEAAIVALLGAEDRRLGRGQP
jgi:hypothetical protein